MRILISVQVDYDEATVPDTGALVEALHKKVADFLAHGALVPLKQEVVDRVSYNVEKVNAV